MTTLLVLWTLFFAILHVEDKGYNGVFKFVTKPVIDLSVPIFGMLLLFTCYIISGG